MTDQPLPGISLQPDFNTIIPPPPRCDTTGVLIPECGCRACCQALVRKYRPPDLTDRKN